MCFALDLGTSKGLGLSDVDIPAAWHHPLLVTEYVAFVLYNPILMATKTSILILYLNIAGKTHTFLRIASFITLAVVNIGGIVLTFITAFQCRPVEAAYNLAIQHPTCISIETIYLASAPVNVATDLAIFVLPIPVLTSLSLPLREKTILVLTFLLGIFVIVVDVARIYYLQLVATSIYSLTSVTPTTSLQFSFNASLALLWSAVEVNVGIICACIPSLRPLVIRLMPFMILDRHPRNITDREVPRSYSGAGISPDSPNPSDPHQPSAASGPELESMHMTAEPVGKHDQHMRITSNTTEHGSMLATSEQEHIEHHVPVEFITMESLKCMLDIQGLEAFKYCALVATVVMLVGFAFGLLFSISEELPLAVNQTQAIGISSATYGGSALAGPALGIWLLRCFGFKTTFITALGISCVGTLMFWPAGALGSFPGFVVSSFVLGIGIGLLDLTATAFWMLCGPPRYGEFRILLGQAVESTAGTLSALLSQKVFFVNAAKPRALFHLQWTYLGVALFTVLLALVFYYMPLPEATDAQVQRQAEKLGIDHSQKHLGMIPVIYVSWSLALLSMFCSTGSTISLRIFMSDLFNSISTSTGTTLSITPLDFNLILTAIEAGTLFIFAFLCLFIPPRTLLLLAYIISITLSTLIFCLDLSFVNGFDTLAIVWSFFAFPLVNLSFAIGLRGLGRWTKTAACMLESSAGIGACVVPFIMLGVQHAGNSAQYSFAVIVALFTVGAVFPTYLNGSRKARWLVDPRGDRSRKTSSRSNLPLAGA